MAPIKGKRRFAYHRLDDDIARRRRAKANRRENQMRDVYIMIYLS